MFETPKFAPIGQTTNVNYNTVGSMEFLKKVLDGSKGTLYELQFQSYVKNDRNNGESYIKLISDLGAKLICNKIASNSYLYINDKLCAEVSFNSNFLTVSALSYDRESLVSVNKKLASAIVPHNKPGYIFAITNQNNRLSLSNIGTAGIKLHKPNYSDEVLESYNFMVKDLRQKSPSGRISILEGPPGTGKTHLVRSLLLEVPGAMFVLMSPDMVQSLSGPQLLPLLVNQKEDSDLNGPIVLLLEDADKCLVARGPDNMNSIQSLLNLGDGILGSMLDLRIIATTNATKLEMEPAIIRSGRLSSRIDVGALSEEKAITLFKTLMPENSVPECLVGKSSILADVYSAARKLGWLPPIEDQYEDDEFNEFDLVNECN